MSVQAADGKLFINRECTRQASMCKEEDKKQKALLAASRDSKRDVTVNPIRKTQLNLLPLGHSHAD